MTKRMMKDEIKGGVIASIWYRIAEDGNSGVTNAERDYVAPDGWMYLINQQNLVVR
jgi:hypothetical protein